MVEGRSSVEGGGAGLRGGVSRVKRAKYSRLGSWGRM